MAIVAALLLEGRELRGELLTAAPVAIAGSVKVTRSASRRSTATRRPPFLTAVSRSASASSRR
jgi:hypothetical protein